MRTRDTSRDTPLPEVGDYWDLAHAERVILTPTVIPTVHPVPLASQVPARPRTSPLTTASLVTALAAFPLIPVLGIGGVVGLLSMVLGAAGVRQIHRHPTRYRGSGRAVTGIVLGTIAAVIGIPIILALAHWSPIAGLVAALLVVLAMIGTIGWMSRRIIGNYERKVRALDEGNASP